MPVSRFQLVRTAVGPLASAALAGLLSTPTLGQAPADAPAASAPLDPVQTDVLIEPRLAKPVPLTYPPEEVRHSSEGWVELGFMVDATGKPFEVTVNSSSGNKAFEKEAMAAVERATYIPGRLNGQPVESATALKVKFHLTDYAPGARPEFVGRYVDLRRALIAKDRPRADAALKRLDVQNLYEDAFLGLAQYAYALQWGDKNQQLAGLNRAITNKTNYNGAFYLGRSELQKAQTAACMLDVVLGNFSEAMDVWSDLVSSGLDPDTKKQLMPTIEKLRKIQRESQPYKVSGTMPDGTWKIGLFESNFRISVSQGHISQVKLRCLKGFVRFAFDPGISYNVASRYGHCGMELDGDPGTTFSLTQF